MTTPTETSAPAQSVNGRGPVPDDLPGVPGLDTGERFLGIGLIVAGVLLVTIGFFRATGRPLPGEGSGQAG